MQKVLIKFLWLDILWFFYWTIVNNFLSEVTFRSFSRVFMCAKNTEAINNKQRIFLSSRIKIWQLILKKGLSTLQKLHIFDLNNLLKINAT